MRRNIRKEQVEAKDVLMAKLRDKIVRGFVPESPQQFADILKFAAEYYKLVGALEECDEILAKLAEADPPVPIVLPEILAEKKESIMAMEKLGVECNADHNPAKAYMEKQASGDLKCRHCGQRFAPVEIQEKVGMQESIAKPQAKKDAIDKMLGL